MGSTGTTAGANAWKSKWPAIAVKSGLSGIIGPTSVLICPLCSPVSSNHMRPSHLLPHLTPVEVRLASTWKSYSAPGSTGMPLYSGWSAVVWTPTENTMSALATDLDEQVPTPVGRNDSRIGAFEEQSAIPCRGWPITGDVVDGAEECGDLQVAPQAHAGLGVLGSVGSTAHRPRTPSRPGQIMFLPTRAAQG